MFERGKAIREAKKAEMVKKAKEDENRRIKELLESRGIALPPEVDAEIFGDAPPRDP